VVQPTCEMPAMWVLSPDPGALRSCFLCLQGSLPSMVLHISLSPAAAPQLTVRVRTGSETPQTESHSHVHMPSAAAGAQKPADHLCVCIPKRLLTGDLWRTHFLTNTYCPPDTPLPAEPAVQGQATWIHALVYAKPQFTIKLIPSQESQFLTLEQ
jgi:hypothetical protein